MKNFGAFLMLCVIVAVLRAAMITLLITLALALVCSFITRPRETLVLLGSLGLLGLAGAQPTAFIITWASLLSPSWWMGQGGYHLGHNS